MSSHAPLNCRALPMAARTPQCGLVSEAWGVLNSRTPDWRRPELVSLLPPESVVPDTGFPELLISTLGAVVEIHAQSAAETRSRPAWAVLGLVGYTTAFWTLSPAS